MTEEAPVKDGKKKRINGLKSVLGGNLLARKSVVDQMPVLLFLVFLGILQITNRYWSERTIRGIEVVQDSIKELKAESVAFEAELMKINTPSEIIRRIGDSGLGLVEPMEPPRKLNVKKLDTK